MGSHAPTCGATANLVARLIGRPAVRPKRQVFGPLRSGVEAERLGELCTAVDAELAERRVEVSFDRLGADY